MPSSSPRVDVDDRALVRPGAAIAPYADSPVGGRPSAAVLAESELWSRSGRSYAPRADDSVFVLVVASPTTKGLLIVLGSITRITANATGYIGSNGYSMTRERVRFPVPAGTAKEFQVGVYDQPGAGSYVFTVTKNGVDTGLTVTLTGSQTRGSIVADVAFSAGDWVDVKAVASGAAPATYASPTIWFERAA